MVKVTHFMLHCFDTPKGKWFDHTDIEKWHLQERGWSKVGYNVVWLLDGTTKIMVPFDSDEWVESHELVNGARGWNGRCFHGSYTGGGNNKDTRTMQQLPAMEATCKMIVMLFADIKLIGHNQVNNKKYCPSFDVPAWAESIGIPEKNIDRGIYY